MILLAVCVYDEGMKTSSEIKIPLWNFIVDTICWHNQKFQSLLHNGVYLNDLLALPPVAFMLDENQQLRITRNIS